MAPLQDSCGINVGTLLAACELGDDHHSVGGREVPRSYVLLQLVSPNPSIAVKTVSLTEALTRVQQAFPNIKR